jgi:hypothetical protein
MPSLQKYKRNQRRPNHQPVKLVSQDANLLYFGDVWEAYPYINARIGAISSSVWHVLVGEDPKVPEPFNLSW